MDRGESRAAFEPLLRSNRVAAIAARLAALRSGEVEAVVAAALEVIADPAEPQLARISAGSVLALLGDPRIDPLAPQMCRVPRGAFWMGIDPVDCAELARRYAIPVAWLLKASPRHCVELDAYEIARFPVTEAEYARFLQDTQLDAAPAHWRGGAPRPERRNHPVHGIDWRGAQLYAEWLCECSGLHYRVAGEAEWERAACGGDARSFPWGEAFESDRCNTREAGVGSTTAVGCYPGGAALCGALDLAGNVEEFVADLYWLYPGSALEDPEQGSYRMTRGGVYSLDADLARCERRHGTPYAGAVGFRLVRSAADEWFGRPGE